MVDNASPDSSWKSLTAEFPNVKFIENKTNVGFAKANNLAAKIADGKYLFLLNPDTELEGNYLPEIVNFAESQKGFGCLGLRMHDALGNFLPESKRAVPDILNSFEKLFNGLKTNEAKAYYRSDVGEFEIAEVDVITGANMLILRERYLSVGGLDEAYFMYGEDIDLCYTLRRRGFKNWYYGKFSILHHKGESTVKDEIYLKRFYGAMQIFVDKYYRNKPIQRMILLSGLKLKQRLALLNLKKK